MTRVDILFFEGCPNRAPACKLVQEVVADLGVEADIHEVEVRGVEEALALEFLGSPSIRVDGRDIEPAGRRRTDFGFACRTYSGEGLPPREMLIAALRGEPHFRSATADETVGKAGDCCSLDDAGDAASAVDKKPGRTGLLAAGGAFVAAVLASVCCWLPLLLVAFGASAGGVGAMFESTRPVFLVLAVVLLAGGFYFTYFRNATCEPGSACEASSRLSRANRSMLWVATAGVVGFALFPTYAGAFLPGPVNAGQVRSLEGTAVLHLSVSGMSCEACTTIVRSELLNVPGVLAADVRYGASEAIVRFDPAARPAENSLIRAVEQAGYTPSPGSAER